VIDALLDVIRELEPVGIDIDAHNVVARLRHAGTGDEAHIAGAEDGYSRFRSF
jgi:hypothetical protein